MPLCLLLPLASSFSSLSLLSFALDFLHSFPQAPWRPLLQPTSFLALLPSQLPSHFHSLIFLLEYSCFTMLLVSTVQQSESVIRIQKSDIWKALAAQSCLTLCYPVDCRLPGSSVHGTLQARIRDRVAIPFFRESSWPRDRTWVSCIASG